MTQTGKRVLGIYRLGLAAAVVCCAAGAIVAVPADGQIVAKRRSDAVAPRLAAKIYKRPLMRSGRIQYCLKQLGRYEGRINGRMTPATVRALRRLRDDYDLSGDDVAQDWALHALLWRRCRIEWTAAGGSLDRFGFAIASSSVPRPEGVTTPRPETPRSRVTPSSAVIEAAPPSATGSTARIPAPATAYCLPTELREVLARSPGPRDDIAACDQPCLPLPPAIDRDDAQAYEHRLGFSWCKACVQFSGELRLEDIARIEKAGNLTLCPDPRRTVRARSGSTAASAVMIVEHLRGTRALFRRDVRAGERHNGLAIVIAVSEYAEGQRQHPRAERDAAGIQAVLVERLGYRADRVIELKNPTLAELDGIFGRSGNGRGLLAERLKDVGDTPVFIYFAGLGAISEEEGAAVLLPADGMSSRPRATGFPLEAMYQNLARSGARQVAVVLEADFAGDPGSPVISPNAPTTRATVLPRNAVRGLVAITASDRDQRPLEDQETGLSLFTRYLIEALSGHADVAPTGNGDGQVDSAEAFVYAAARTGIAARKVSGVLQRPTISQSQVLTVGRLAPPSRP